MIYVGSIVRQLRTDRNLSQKQLSSMVGITPSFLSLVESDKRAPSTEVLSRLAAAFGVSEAAIVWSAVDLPPSLSEEDREICEAAQQIALRLIAPRT